MLKIAGVTRVYRMGGQEVCALAGIDLNIDHGEFVRIVGSSGSGKSTLLNLVAGLDRPSGGRIETPLGELGSISRRDLAKWRATAVGMVFQSFNLIGHRTALQNVELGLLFCAVKRKERLARAAVELERLGLADRMHHRPGDLSGGEQQRVALARALVKRPQLLLADEPTGNLDAENSSLTARLLAEFNSSGVTVLLVTHDATLAVGDAHRTIKLSYGRVVERIDHRIAQHVAAVTDDKVQR